jgi:addiction module HigA family antidote
MAKQKILAPGDVLKEQIAEYQLTIGGLAQELKLNQSSLRQITEGKTKISVPLAFRLAKYFNTPVQYWIDLQSTYEIAELKKDQEFQGILSEIPKAKKKKTAAAAPASSKSKKGDDASAKKAAAKETKAPKESKAAAEMPSPGTKRRGRPQAVKDGMDAAPDAEKPKRRGRPQAVKDGVDAAPDTEKPKRRGRPPVVKDAADTEKPKRRRGRPPASVIAADIDVEDAVINTEKSKPKTILIKKNSISSPEPDSLFEDPITGDIQT